MDEKFENMPRKLKVQVVNRNFVHFSEPGVEGDYMINVPRADWDRAGCPDQILATVEPYHE